MGRRASIHESAGAMTSDELFAYKTKLISSIREYMKANDISYLQVSQGTGISYPTVKRILDIGREGVYQDENYDFQFSYVKKMVDYLRLPDTIFDNGELPETQQPRASDVDLSFLRKLDSALPPDQYAARILNLSMFLTHEQQKVISDLICSYFNKSELPSS